MRFTLADLKKTIARRKGEPHLVPFLLRPGDLAEPLEALIALFESQVGRERVHFPDDRPAELIGDYRLARCLVICLSEWYEWQAPEWPEGATPDEAASLAAHCIDSPGALRLALYDHVNATAGGYLAGDERDATLDVFAAQLGLARSTLADLLRLDAEPQAVLERFADAAPTAAELAARYNQRAVETVLANASVVEWIITPPHDGRASDAERPGTVVKRACFLARRMGVQYEVAFAEETPPLPLPGAGRGREESAAATGEESTPPQSAAGRVDGANEGAMGKKVAPPKYGEDNLARRDRHRLGAPPRAGEGGEVRLVAERPAHYSVNASLDTTLDIAVRPLVLTLYGPQELTGAPAQYGERLAQLCRALLGYRRDVAARGRAAFAGSGLQGSARVYLHGRPLTYTMDDRLVRLLSRPTAPDEPLSPSDIEARDASPVSASPAWISAALPASPDPYDSSLERQLAEEWASLERERATAGWRLEREPEPILAGQTILVPDFALRRDGRRVFLEIAGYWRPEYRERKVRKLRALNGAIPLILAAPEVARPDFSPLAGQVPMLWYRTYLSAPALVALLERDYNDFDARLATLDIPRIRAEIVARGRIPPEEAFALVRCYTRAEMANIIARLGRETDAPRWIEGIGLCSSPWHDALRDDMRALVAEAPGSRLTLAALAARLVSRRPDITSLSQSALEAMAPFAGLRVERASLFAAEVCLDEVARADRERSVPPGGTSIPADGNPGGLKSQPRRAAERKQTKPRTKPRYSTAAMFGPEFGSEFESVTPEDPTGEDGDPRSEGGHRERRRK